MVSPRTPLASNIDAAAASVIPSKKSTTKWNGVRNLVAEAVRLEESAVYVSTVSKSGNVSVRLGQSSHAAESQVLVAMFTGPASDLSSTLEKCQTLAMRQGKSVCLFRRSNQGVWNLVAGFMPEGGAGLASLKESYPSARIS